MAFVYRAPKKDLKSQTAEYVGPGSYSDVHDGSAGGSIVGGVRNQKPFNSTSIKAAPALEFKLKEELPGPGHYNIQTNQMEKVVISSPDEEIKVIEIPKPSPFFKDAQLRFAQAQDKNPGPGPGSYCIEQPNKRKIKGGVKIQSRPKNVIEQLMQINRYSSIPSIPGRQHQFGYTESENNVLELNQLNPNLSTPDVARGPGSYELRGAFTNPSRARGISWHAQNPLAGKTLTQERIDKSFVGPGAYEINGPSQAPLYKLKQSAAFSSKCQREQLRGERSSSRMAARARSSLPHGSSTYSAASSNQNDFDDSDSDYEYIEDATPGPGYYHNDSTSSSIKSVGKPEKFQYFGSRQERFKDLKSGSLTDNPVGPGHYNPVDPLLDMTLASKNKTVPFGSSNTRFEVKIFQEVKPSPGQYDPKNSFEDKLIYKIQRGYRGNFGSTEGRFKRGLSSVDPPGPGTYLDPIIEKEQEEQKPSAAFVSKTRRNLTVDKKKAAAPAPGSYNIDIFDIHKKALVDEEDDPDLAVKRPGFLSGEPRFRDPNRARKNRNDDDDDDDDIPYDHHKQISDLYKKKPKHVSAFGSKVLNSNHQYHSRLLNDYFPQQLLVKEISSIKIRCYCWSGPVLRSSLEQLEQKIKQHSIC